MTINKYNVRMSRKAISKRFDGFADRTETIFSTIAIETMADCEIDAEHNAELELPGWRTIKASQLTK